MTQVRVLVGQGRQVKLLLLVVSLLALSGCFTTRTGHLYPVKGPLVTQQPQPVYTLTASGILSGDVTVRLPDGESCSGKWTFVSQGIADSSLASAWDVVYGSGFYVSHVLGSKLYARSTVSDGKGTQLNVEFYKASNTEHDPLLGVAQDQQGDIFKVTF